MKKKLESELVSIAHRILKLKGKEDVLKMYNEVAVLYEKLAVLKFAHENFEGDMPTIGSDSSFFGMLDVAFNNKYSDNIEVEDKIYINLDDVEDDGIMEHGITTIKDIVSQMPEETHVEENVGVETETEVRKSPDHHKIHIEDIAADFQEMPVFEPVAKNGNEKKSLNDKLKNGGLNIGLNDKLAFIKHLFNGSTEDYERVISQINTTTSFKDAKQFITSIVKPDYDWSDKEEYEERLLELIESKFD